MPPQKQPLQIKPLHFGEALRHKGESLSTYFQRKLGKLFRTNDAIFFSTARIRPDFQQKLYFHSFYLQLQFSQLTVKTTRNEKLVKSVLPSEAPRYNNFYYNLSFQFYRAEIRF